MTVSAQTSTRGELAWLLLIVGIAIAVRLAAIVAFPHTPVSDELVYKSMALNLLAGDGIIDDMGNRTMYNVGYPLFVLYPVFSVFGEDITAARVVNAILGGLATWLCYAIAHEAGAGRLGRLIAALSWAIYLPAGVYAVYLLKENLMIPLMLGAFWFVLRLSKTPSLASTIGCGVLFGLLALVGNAALTLAGALLIALVVAPTTWRTKAGTLGTIIVATVLVASPWMIRNYQVLGAPVLNTNGGFNLYLGNNPAATGMFVSIADTPRGETWEALREQGEIQASETLKSDAVDWIKQHPAAFIELAFTKLAYFWTPPVHEGKGPVPRTEQLVRTAWALQFLVLVIGAVMTLLFKHTRRREVVLMWVAIAGYTAVHMLFYVIFRYREPIMPLLCVLAALTLETIYHHYRSRRRRKTLE